jgi:hypothetical protein
MGEHFAEYYLARFEMTVGQNYKWLIPGLILAGSLFGLSFDSKDGGGTCLRTFERISIELHGVTSQ